MADAPSQKLMRPFLFGVVVGGLVATGCILLLDWQADVELPDEAVAEHNVDRTRDLASQANTPVAAAPPIDAEPIVREPVPQIEVVGTVDLAAAELTMHIGEGYVFGEGALRARDDRDQADLYCQDIRHGASLYCSEGAGPALAPMTAIGLPESAPAAARLVLDAPAVLAARNLHLVAKPTPKHPGLGFVRARDGRTFKLWLLEEVGHPDALERKVRIGFAEVQATEGGGQFQLPTQLGAPPAATLQNIRDAIAIGGRIPGSNFHQYLEGAFQSVGQLGAETKLREDQFVSVAELSGQKVTADRRAAIFVAGRLRADASIVLASGGAAGVGEDLEGTMRTDGYGYVFVGRDVLGTLDLRSYATATVLGDVRGKIRVRSYIDLYVRGRMLGTLDLKGSCWSTFYFQSFLGRADLERLKGSKQVTLHLRVSDLAPGRHTDIGQWREVIVGDPVWEKLAR